MKLVIAADVMISAYGTDALSRKLWQNELKTHQLLISPEIFAEVERNIRKSEFGLTGEQVKAVLQDILQRCQLVRITPKSEDRTRVPSKPEPHLVLLAVQTGADAIVTSDQSLSAQSTSHKIPVLTLKELVRRQNEQ